MGATAALALQAATFITGAVSKHNEANSLRAQGEYSGTMSDQNALLADAQAKDAVDRGAQQEGRFRASTRQLIGSQRAAFAASGVDIGSGSAADVQADSARMGEFDALTIRNNAAREAWGYQVQGANDRAAAINARMGANNEAASRDAGAISTLLTGSANLAGSWQKNPPSFRLSQTFGPTPKSKRGWGGSA